MILRTARPAEARSAKVDLGKLSVFSAVREFPTRIKCASLGVAHHESGSGA